MVGNGLEGSLTGTGRLEVILVVAIVVLAAVLLLVRFRRSTEHKRRKGAAMYFDKNAANKGPAGRDVSTGTAVYPSSGPPGPQTMAPSFAAPRKGASQQAGGPAPGRSRATTAPPDSPAAPGFGATADARAAVSSPVLDTVPPLRTEGIILPTDKGARSDLSTTSTPPASRTPTPTPSPSPSSAQSSAQSSARTAVPANLPPLAPPPPNIGTPEHLAGTDGAGGSSPVPEPVPEPDPRRDQGDDAPHTA